MKFSHFNVINQPQFVDSIYQDVYQLIAVYITGKAFPEGSDYLVIETFKTVDDGITALKQMNEAINNHSVK